MKNFLRAVRPKPRLHLPPGVYMLTFRNNDWVITRKFVKK
ncbi:MAG: T9SS type A sorting domain-containing protein [Bacteroidales bacterium]|nr:T9SS type A sorting domain-containing protein [Bacteroidales bacterium]